MFNKAVLKKIVPTICIVAITTGCSNVNAMNKNKEQSKLVVMEDHPLDILIDQDKEIQEQLISKSKKVLGIGNEYSNVSFRTMKETSGQYIKDLNQEVLYEILWNKDEKDLKHISVTTTKDGHIRTYQNTYVDESKQGQDKLSKEEASKVAKEFIEKIYPEIVNKIDITDIREIEDSEYRIDYVRQEKGIPFYDNEVEVCLNASTGEITFFYIEWNRDIKFTDKKDIISKEEAKKLFKEKIDLQLLYKLDYKNNKSIPDLVYSIKNEEKSIDAQTKEDLSSGSSRHLDSRNDRELRTGTGRLRHDKVTLSKNEERSILNGSNKIISKEEAENIAREFGVINKSYNMDISNLTTDKNRTSYIWELQFIKKDSDGGMFYATVEVDSIAKEVINFTKDVTREKTSGDIKYDRKKSLKIAESFIKKAQPLAFENIVLVDTEAYELEGERYQAFSFGRKENGIHFSGNGFYITIDSTTGEVTSYNYVWDDVEGFVNKDKIISEEEAYEVLLSNYDLVLKYVLPSEDYERVDNMVRLVYGIDHKKWMNVNAITGEIIK